MSDSDKPWWGRFDGVPKWMEPKSRTDRQNTARVLALAAFVIVAGLLLGAVVDGAWYLRLPPFGVGLLLGAILVRSGSR